MEYRRLGTTGVTVSRQGLGTMMFGSLGNSDQDDSVRIIRAALDAGINLIDTADVYSRGESEEIVGRAIRGRRADVVLATKFHNPMGRDPNRRGNSRRWIMMAVEESLRRLDTDHIDIYQAHRHDWHVDLDETLGALTDLVRQGKIRYIGSSSFPASWIVEAQWAAHRGHHTRFVSEQPQYSLLARSPEAEVLPTCRRHDVGVLGWSPLAGGWLTGKYRRGTEVAAGSRYGVGGPFSRAHVVSTDDPASQARFDAVESLVRIADQAGLSLLELALGFVGEHPAVTSTIIGPRTRAQLDGLLAAADIRLDTATLDAIDTVVAPGTDVAGIDHVTGDPSLRASHRRAPAPRK